MLKKNVYSWAKYQEEPEVVAGKKCIYDNTGFWCSGKTINKVSLLKSTLAGAENLKSLMWGQTAYNSQIIQMQLLS